MSATPGQGEERPRKRAPQRRAGTDDGRNPRRASAEPRRSDGGEESHAVDESANDEASPPTVLFVDDEQDLADVYALWLSSDYDVRTAYSGREALDELDGVDVVFLDRKMPGLSGSEVLAWMRERGVGCRVVMLSALTPDDGVDEDAYDAYLTKPVKEHDIREVLEAVLDDGTES